MTIKPHNGPLSGRKVMQRALLQRLPQAPQFGTPTGGGMQTGSPIPVYLLAPHRLVDSKPLDWAELTSWRYPVVGAAEASMAEIREGRNGVCDFAGLSRGLLSKRVFDAADLAERSLAAHPTVYEPRLLEVPALRFVALWLFSGEDQLFIPLLEGTPPGSAPLIMVDDVIVLLRARAGAPQPNAAKIQPSAFGISSPTN